MSENPLVWVRERIAARLARTVNREEVIALRAALADACETCEYCKGFGYRPIAGAFMRCPRCGSWRNLLNRKAVPHG